MKSTDSADATARALDLLPPGDPAGSDPRMLRDPQLIAQARATREAAADVWLAVSPLHAAPPDVLQTVMRKIAPPIPVRPGMGRRLHTVIAVSGWAAALALLISLWPEAGKAPGAASVRETPQGPAVRRGQPQALVPAVRYPRDGRLRAEIARLQERLAEAGESRKSTAPRVIALSAPGAVNRSPEEVRRRVQAILTNALRAAMEAESSSPSDPASLVIERGWLNGGMLKAGTDGVVRHLNFPEHAWLYYGMLRSQNGSYYDSGNALIWVPDPDGYGFVGRSVTAGDDLAGFHAGEGDSPGHRVAPARPGALAEGFIIENPAERTAEVIIDQVPPAAEGYQHLIVLADVSGNTETRPVEASVSIGVPAALQNTSTANFGSSQQAGGLAVRNLSESGTLHFTLQDTHGLTSFQLLERPLIPNGQPDRIIVEGSP